MKKYLVLMVLIATLFVLAACSPSESTNLELSGKTWVAASLNGSPLVETTVISAEFTEDGKISGTAGCNSYSGTYTTSGSEIEIKQPMASTMMACPEPVMKQETDYFQALAAAKSFKIKASQLTLEDANGTELVSYTVQAQDLPNTTWLALSYNNGKQAVVSVMTDNELTATFEGDGSLTGFAGCNNFNGPYKTNGLNIKIGPLASTMKSCEVPEGVMDQEAQYLAALQSAATYERLGDRLELRTADGALAAEFIRNE